MLADVVGPQLLQYDGDVLIERVLRDLERVHIVGANVLEAAVPDGEVLRDAAGGLRLAAATLAQEYQDLLHVEGTLRVLAEGPRLVLLCLLIVCPPPLRREARNVPWVLEGRRILADVEDDISFELSFLGQFCFALV